MVGYAASLHASSGNPNPSTFLDSIFFNSASRAPGTRRPPDQLR